MTDLIEGKFYYTDRGIEKCHYCGVNGVVELVTPKGKVLAPVPSYEELQELKNSRDGLIESVRECVQINKRLKSERDEIAYDLGVADTKNGELLRHMDTIKGKILVLAQLIETSYSKGEIPFAEERQMISICDKIKQLSERK